MNDSLGRVADLVRRQTGIQTKGSQLDALAAAVGRVSPGMDPATLLTLLDDPGRPELLDRLIDEVAVQETFFMRQPRELEAVDWHRLLAAAHARGAEEVTVWVAACASGEEAYSVAMLAVEAFGHGPAPVSILATDISAGALGRAREGLYSARSMQEVGDERRARFFAQVGRRSRVGDQLRSMVRFRQHNLVLDSVPPAGEDRFDLILCRNVLIYFEPKTVEAVIGSLEGALRPGGQLILGASDRLMGSAQRLAEIAAQAPARTHAPPVPRTVRRRRAGLRKPLRRAERGDQGPAGAPADAGGVRQALEAANAGRYPAAVETTERLLAEDPLDAEAHFVQGLTQLAGGDPATAIRALRRALYIDPTFTVAAFQLGRAHDRHGDARAARRAYAQALRTIGADDRHRDLLGALDVGDVAAACRARLATG